MEVTNIPAFDAESAVYQEALGPEVLAVSVTHAGEEDLLDCPVRWGYGALRARSI